MNRGIMRLIGSIAVAALLATLAPAPSQALETPWSPWPLDVAQESCASYDRADFCGPSLQVQMAWLGASHFGESGGTDPNMMATIALTGPNGPVPLAAGDKAMFSPSERPLVSSGRPYSPTLKTRAATGAMPPGQYVLTYHYYVPEHVDCSRSACSRVSSEDYTREWRFEWKGEPLTTEQVPLVSVVTCVHRKTMKISQFKVRCPNKRWTLSRVGPAIYGPA